MFVSTIDISSKSSSSVGFLSREKSDLSVTTDTSVEAMLSSQHYKRPSTSLEKQTMEQDTHHEEIMTLFREHFL
jgi:hypothetical protein